MLSSSRPYSDEIARIYDLLVEGREDAEAEGQELEFLLWTLRDACPRQVKDVLDAGCGTGRHLIPLLREGYRVAGLDNSAAMIEECRRKLDSRALSAELAVANLGGLDYDACFDAVLCMNSVICYLPDTDAIVGALRGFVRALRPGGMLLLDNCNFLAQWMTFGETYWNKREGERARIEFQERRWYDDFASIFHIEIEATVHEGERSYELRNRDDLRVMTVGEMTMHLKEAGFTAIAAYPSFDLSHADEPCGERMIFLALRAAAG